MSNNNHAVTSDTAAGPSSNGATEQPDHWLWLEDIKGEKPLEWVAHQNALTQQAFAQSSEYQKVRDSVLEVMDADARIPFVRKLGDYYYNFWKDGSHPRGYWRRTTLEEYRKATPEWETVLDVDALGQQEGRSWVWQGATGLPTDERYCLILLSPDGGDACEVREFDLVRKQFVRDGFVVPVAKNLVSWIDRDHIYVASDFGPGSLTSSSYPRIVKEWQRGTPLSEARVIFEGQTDDMLVMAHRDHFPGFERDFVTCQKAFYSNEVFLREADNRLTRIDVPEDAEVDTFGEWLLINLRSDWQPADTLFPQGALLAAPFDAFMQGQREMTALFTPTASTSLAGYSTTRHHLLLTLMKDVASHVEVLTPQSGTWHRESLGAAPALSSVSASAVAPYENDDYFLTVTSFLTPTTLYLGSIGGQAAALKQAPAFFDAARYQVAQHFAVSKDGTRIPYFEMAPKDLAGKEPAPTLLYGYGGFEVSLTPYYSGSNVRSWLERGGVYVIANIRGGGEYGPRWHQAALKANRLRAYEDFAAVGEDLIARGVTTASRLGALGGSNGGLLAGNMLTLYPQLFGAIVSEVPLLDMKRYTHLSAGASWIGEYGDPDKPEEWAWIKQFSPYHNLDAHTAYPPVLFYTATSDDRVGPVQARKMAAKMKEMGLPNVWFYENTEGGHGASVDNSQTAAMVALTTQFLWHYLDKAPQQR